MPEPKPVLIILGLGEDCKCPSPLKALLAPLQKIGYTIAFDSLAPKGDISILIFGLDPGKHEVPEELNHQLRKLQKDYTLRYGTEAKNEVYNRLLKESGFVPKEKIVKPKIII
jgi:hypothetical protein